MSVPQARVSSVAERWDRERVLALAPDAPSQRTALSLASGRAWPAAGAAAGADAVWGECRGRAAPHRGRPGRAGVPVLVPQPEVPVQARAGPAAALVRRFGAGRRGRSAR